MVYIITVKIENKGVSHTMNTLSKNFVQCVLRLDRHRYRHNSRYQYKNLLSALCAYRRDNRVSGPLHVSNLAQKTDTIQVFSAFYPLSKNYFKLFSRHNSYSKNIIFGHNSQSINESSIVYSYITILTYHELGRGTPTQLWIEIHNLLKNSTGFCSGAEAGQGTRNESGFLIWDKTRLGWGLGTKTKNNFRNEKNFLDKWENTYIL
jgi:hypothetical protein